MDGIQTEHNRGRVVTALSTWKGEHREDRNNQLNPIAPNLHLRYYTSPRNQEVAKTTDRSPPFLSHLEDVSDERNMSTYEITTSLPKPKRTNNKIPDMPK